MGWPCCAHPQFGALASRADHLPVIAWANPWLVPSVYKVSINYPWLGMVEVDGKQWAWYSTLIILTMFPPSCPSFGPVTPQLWISSFFLPILVFYWFFPSMGKISTNYPWFGIVEDRKQWVQYSSFQQCSHLLAHHPLVPAHPNSGFLPFLDFSFFFFFFQFLQLFHHLKKVNYWMSCSNRPFHDMRSWSLSCALEQ